VLADAEVKVAASVPAAFIFLFVGGEVARAVEGEARFS
jgi:hypothetical protein